MLKERSTQKRTSTTQVKRKKRQALKLPALFTIGHSNLPITKFIKTLQAHGIKRLVDVRTIPRSHANPQFNLEALKASLKSAKIFYTHLPALGGLRHARKDSPNSAWRNASFRGYADYMQTAEFESGLKKLLTLAQKKRVAIMCAEALPWRCHRSLIADVLVARRGEVLEIFNKTSARPHRLTSFARVRRGKVLYPAQ